jgi:hypothetical protein
MLFTLASVQIFPSILFSNTLNVYNIRGFRGGAESHFVLLRMCQHPGGQYCLHTLPLRWQQYVPRKQWHPTTFTRLHGVKPHNTTIRVVTLREEPRRTNRQGRTTAQADSRRPVTEGTRARAQANPCDICGGQNGTRTGFSSSTFGFFLSLSFHQCSIFIWRKDSSRSQTNVLALN